jgi:CubicO group peptidase (beta-lactamase class C family)
MTLISTTQEPFAEILAEAALLSSPVDTPGMTFLYSNWGYVVAGHIIEELADATRLGGSRFRTTLSASWHLPYR